MLCIDFNIPLCEVIFSLVAMAMLEKRKKRVDQVVGAKNNLQLGDKESKQATLLWRTMNELKQYE